MSKSVLITIPHPSLPGGVASIYRVLKLDESGENEYFINTSARRSADPGFFAAMLVRFVLHVRRVRVVQLNPSLDVKAIIRDGILLLVAKLFHKPVIVFFHGWNERFENFLLRKLLLKKLFAFVYNKPDAYCLLGTIFSEKLKGLGVYPGKTFYLPSVADDTYYNKLSLGDGPFGCNNKRTILFLSRFDKQKGMDIALMTFKLLQELKTTFDLKLIMAGDGPFLASCKNMVSRNNIENVFFEGYVDGEKKHRILKEADILFFPTCYGEGLPCVIMEAMLYGLAVVTRPVGAIPYWVKQNNGWITDSIEPKVFVRGILSLLEKPGLLQSIKKTNQEIAKAHFTPQKMKEQLQHIHHQFLYDCYRA